jgi:hypothetical protein
MNGPSIISRPLKLYKIEAGDVFAIVSAFSPDQAGEILIADCALVTSRSKLEVTEIKLDNKVEVKALIIVE